MIFDTIYKRTQTGATQKWFAETSGSKWRSHYGQLDGVVTTTKWIDAMPTNIGKANERNGEDQSTFEVMAEYRKKLAQGRYAKNIEDIDDTKYFAPMLAYPVKKYPVTNSKINKVPTYSQPKIDGVRGIATIDGFFTRKGKKIVAVDHISEELKAFFVDHPDVILDGELYNHDLRDNLNVISGLCRKSKLSESDLSATNIIQYHVYDVITDPELMWNDRLEILNTYASTYFPTCSHVFVVPTTTVTDEIQLDILYSEYMEQGFEGQMIRYNAKYKNARSRDLLKRKEFTDEEFTIVRIIEGTGNRSGMAGAIEYQTSEGKTFRSGIAGGEQFYKEIWKDRDEYVGGMGTVRWFKISEYGIPLLPVTHDVYKGLREI